MTAAKKKSSQATTTKAQKAKRNYYWINELASLESQNRFGYSVEDLFDFGANGKLTLSFIAAGRCLISGDYHNDNETEEIPQDDRVISGPLPIMTEDIWKILADGRVTIEFTNKTETSFGRLEHSEALPLPVVTRDQVLITTRDWQRFKDGLPPDSEQEKNKESPAIAGALALLYAREKGHYLASGEINMTALLKDIQDNFSSTEGLLPRGLSKTNFYNIKPSIEYLSPLLKSTVD